MSEPIAVQDQIAETVALLRAQLGVSGKDLSKALRKARHRLPRRIYRQATKLAKVEGMATHPKLRLTLDTPALAKAAREVQEHLRNIDVADRRKGWWLGAFGALAFNILLFGALLIMLLMWRDLI
ncbi:hypothetical protein TRL7639_02960 [Falsiruegeria litorea R37]|uniref:Uncharacterized protein n=1 Tax=Falsiruegeria litorea R37 TaxID=1200284 RepID=A0A1Y5T4W2_9RHOB|nr:hypothetical protein [Falsiruegeria litorea]SLN55478.1 hypothetical protein TRL7639_02960 [Falsiruegeria litorea R37]